MLGCFLQVLPPTGPQRPATLADIVGTIVTLGVAIFGSMAWVTWKEKRAARQSRRARERELALSRVSKPRESPVSDASHEVLVATSVRYGSPNDERAFFEWLQRIEGVDRVQGTGRDLRIHVRRDMDELALRDLVASFFRYGVDLTQIPKVFAVEEHAWLLNDTAYWFRAMFPERMTP
jgi:hypothetical protein